MTTTTAHEVAEILERVREWPADQRITLARRILETTTADALERPGGTEPAPKRGRPVEELIGLGAGSGPPPTDEEVKQWIDEHRTAKYGK